jgi:hypothetical protein
MAKLCTNKNPNPQLRAIFNGKLKFTAFHSSELKTRIITMSFKT